MFDNKIPLYHMQHRYTQLTLDVVVGSHYDIERFFLKSSHQQTQSLPLINKIQTIQSWIIEWSWFTRLISTSQRIKKEVMRE